MVKILLAAAAGLMGLGIVLGSILFVATGHATDPEPEFALVAGSVRGATTHPTTADLVVEVADSSLRFDTTKLTLSAAAAIADYWVLDVFRDPASGKWSYRSQAVLGLADHVAPLAMPGRTVRVADLFP